MGTSRIARGDMVDVSDFKRFAKVLRKAAPDSSVKMRKGLRASAAVVAEKTKDNASFSSRIPGSVGIRTSGVTVAVVAGGTKAPNAAPIENHGKGKVRHPIPNSDQWTDKSSHDAFMTPAVHETVPLFAAAMADVVSDTIDDVVREMRG